MNAEEHEGSWCKKDLEQKGGCSRYNVHVDLHYIWVIQSWVLAGEGRVQMWTCELERLRAMKRVKIRGNL